MMHKIVGVGSWDRLTEEPAQLVKMASGGLANHDRAVFLKRADHALTKALENVKIARGDIPIHLIAVCATEGFGSNRNGDGFKEADCREHHGRFVTKARYYRNHKNKDPDKSYGKVAASAYNEPMRRIELLVVGNGTKEAAERNGGLVMPDDDLHALNRGDALPWSMATTIDYDVCQNCHNKAANRSEYCTEDTCISPETGRRMFGCRDGLTKLAWDGLQQFVDNPNPGWFDISKVGRPADPSAWGAKADYMTKAASAGHVIGGAELAEIYANQNGYGTILRLNDQKASQKQAVLLHKLAQLETAMEGNTTERHKALALGLAESKQRPIEIRELGPLDTGEVNLKLAAMASRRVLLPFRDFVRLLTGDNREKTAQLLSLSEDELPGVFGRLASDPVVYTKIASSAFAVTVGPVSAQRRSWADKFTRDHSLELSSIVDRAQRAALYKDAETRLRSKSTLIKSGACGELAQKIAEQYALYQLSALASMATPEELLPLTLECVVLQNKVVA